MDDGILELVGCLIFTASLYLIIYFGLVKGKSKLHQQFHANKTRESIAFFLLTAIRAVWIVIISSASLIPIVIIFGTTIENNFSLFLVFAVPTFCITAFLAARKVRI